MAEKKVGKADQATIIVRKENGDKIIARGSVFFDAGQVTLLAGQVLEIRREDGTLVFAQKDALTLTMLARAVQGIDLEQSKVRVTAELAKALGIS